MKWKLIGILWIFIGSSCGNDSFVFPDGTNISVNAGGKLSGNEESNDFQKRNEFENGNTDYVRRPGHHAYHEKDLGPPRRYHRPSPHLSYAPNTGIVNHGYHHRPNENSHANAQANAQASNGYVISNSQANSQSSNYGSSYYPSSASSSASATTGIVNGRPVAAASAAAAAAGPAGSSSASSGATASGGYGDSAMAPWYYRNRIASDEMKEEKEINDDEKITFLE